MKASTSRLQAISEAEGEVTKRKVQIAAASKQAEKLGKDCTKTQKELDKANADLEGKQQEQQVSPGPCSPILCFQLQSHSCANFARVFKPRKAPTLLQCVCTQHHTQYNAFVYQQVAC